MSTEFDPIGPLDAVATPQGVVFEEAVSVEPVNVSVVDDSVQDVKP